MKAKNRQKQRKMSQKFEARKKAYQLETGKKERGKQKRDLWPKRVSGASFELEKLPTPSFYL